jgi:hypothetical protein
MYLEVVQEGVFYMQLALEEQCVSGNITGLKGKNAQDGFGGGIRAGETSGKQSRGQQTAGQQCPSVGAVANSDHRLPNSTGMSHEHQRVIAIRASQERPSVDTSRAK